MVRLEAPVHVGASFGFMGVVGVIVNIVFFFLDIVSDFLLAFVLWVQARETSNTNPEESHETMTWFIITICIIVVPMVIINLFSLLWYWQNKLCLGDYCVLHKMSRCQVVLRVIFHILLLGPLVRYLDILRYGLKMQRETKEVEMGPNGAVRRRTPKGEVHAVLQMVISRDTAMLDMMHSFLQDAPQLIFQVFLLYHSPEVVTGSETNSSQTMVVQVAKVLVGVVTISWSLVSYQDELRRSTPGRQQLSFGATIVCLLWRSAMVASRVIAIGTFLAIAPPGNSDNSLLRLIFRTSKGDEALHISYPTITAIFLLVHWVLMTVWIHAQRTTFCSADDGSPRPVLETLYNGVMGLVHVFCYINLKDTPSRRRMVFFYLLTLLENTGLVAVWCVEMQATTALWLEVSVVFSVVGLWVVGICCVVGYYAFMHPDTTVVNRGAASWRG